MTFILPKYRGYTAATIKSRAEIPDQADMTVNGDNVEYNLVNMTKIRDGIGAAVLKQTELHNHANVNHWSGFGPTTRTEVAGVLENSIENPYGKNEFAGYNHTAPTPAFANTAHLDDVWVNYNGTATFAADLTIGEPKYTGGDVSNHSDCVGIALTVWDGSSLVGSGIEDLAGYENTVSLSADIAECTAEKTYTCKIYFVNDLNTFAENLDNVCFQLSELANYTVDLKIRTLTAEDLSGATGWTLGTHGLNRATSEYTLTSFSRATDSLGLTVQL